LADGDMTDIGSTLQEARMRARIDISEVESATKIRAKYLRAIENEEWEMLPGPTFVKSFLRTYAEYLGIDGRLLVEEYKLRHEPLPDQNELQPIAPPRADRRLRAPRPPRIPRGWLIAGGLVGLLIVLIVLGSIGNGNDSTPVATRPQRTTPKPRPSATPAVPTRATLQLTPTAEVYVCLRNAADQLVVNQTLTPDGGTRTYRSKRFKLTVGNSSLTMKVNGKGYTVKPSATATTFDVTPKGRRLLPNDNAC
jgi:cytoskeletal protein RodZ